MSSKEINNRFKYIVLYFVSFLFYLSSLFILLSLKNIAIAFRDLLLILGVPIILILTSKIVVRIFKNSIDFKKLEEYSGDIFTAYVAGIAIFMSIIEKTVIIQNLSIVLGLLFSFITFGMISSLFMLILKKPIKFEFLFMTIISLAIISLLMIHEVVIYAGATLTLSVGLYDIHGNLIKTLTSQQPIDWLRLILIINLIIVIGFLVIYVIQKFKSKK